MTKFKCTIEQEIEVKFKDPEKAKRVYLGDEWKSVFYDFDGLDEVAGHLSFAMDAEDGRWNPDTKRTEQFVEGFGSFIWKGSGEFELSKKESVSCGGIIVTFDDREITDTVEESTQ